MAETKRISENLSCRLIRKSQPFLVTSFESCDLDRFTKVATSLAIPISMLLEHAWKRGDRKRIQKLEDSFVEGIRFLCGLKWWEDQDLDLIKFHSSLLFQLAVNDIDAEVGHPALEPSSSVAELTRQHVFSGQIRKEIRIHLARARGGDLFSLQFFASYLLGKRGWPELSRSKRFQTVKDHQNYLGAKAVPVDTGLLEEVRRTVRKTLGSVRSPLSKLSPSHNASYDSSRKAGGAFSVVTERVGDLPECATLHDLATEMYAWKRGLWQDICVTAVNRQDFRPRDLAVRVQVIPEPGKFRVITAGDAYLYTFLQPLQGRLLEKWARTSYSTMRDAWEEEVVSWHAPPGWVWNSGDYKAATDQLNIHATLEAWEVIREMFELPWGFLSGLEGTNVEYSADDVKRFSFGGERLPRAIWQRNGQLMGHPLSFPILCFINLSGLISALKRGQKQKLLSSNDAKLILQMTKINGDDILFPCPKSFCKVWEDTAGELGLKLTVGKSYASADFAMVNNVMFRMVDSGEYQRTGRMNVRIGYLNQKLIQNMSLKSGEASESPLEIGKAANRMCETCPSAVRFLRDLRRNRNGYPVTADGARILPNLFVDCKLGGLGVDEKFRTGPRRASVVDRQLASLLAEGQLNSFLLAGGVAVPRRFRKLWGRIPKVRLTTSANAEEFLSTRKGVEKEEGRSYKGLVGMLSQFSSVADIERRHLDVSLRKLRSVRPMSTEKVFDLHPEFLFPHLPLRRGDPAIRYPRNWNLLSTESGKVGDEARAFERSFLRPLL